MLKKENRDQEKQVEELDQEETSDSKKVEAKNVIIEDKDQDRIREVDIENKVQI